MDEPIRRKLMFKVILIGEISVGKTSLMRRFVHKTFAGDTKGTIGADFMVKGTFSCSKTISLFYVMQRVYLKIFFFIDRGHF